MAPEISSGAKRYFSPKAIAVYLVASGKQVRNPVNPVNPV
jgi:hypothetical protein